MLIVAIIVIVALLVVAAAWIAWTRPAWLLIARVIYHDVPRPFRDARAIWDLLGVGATLERTASMLDRASLYRAVRQRVEWALLCGQDPGTPSFVRLLHDANEQTVDGRIDLNQVRLRHSAARHAHTVSDTEARERMYAWLQANRAGARRGVRHALLNYVLARRKKKNLEAMLGAERRLASALGEPAAHRAEGAIASTAAHDDSATRGDGQHGSPARSRRIIEVENCFALTRAVDGIRRYFDALATGDSVRYPFDGQFLTPVRIRKGYFAPLHLLAGALAEFENDWAPAIQQYGRAVTANTLGAGRDDLLRLREFAFNCWLSWGPSIPVCTCMQWRPCIVAGSDADHNGNWDQQPVFQYGYGDEANSVSAVFATAEHGKPLFEHFRQRGRHGTLALARPLEGRIALGAGLATIGRYEQTASRRSQGIPVAICPAQTQLLRDWERIVVRVDAPPDEAQPSGGPVDAGPVGYYSAYMWVMFELCDARGATRALTTEAWRSLLPFFEHGNLADSDTYDETCHTLVRKVTIALEAILTANPQFGARYACAFDDSNCGWPLWCEPGQAGRRSLRAMLQAAIDDPARSRGAWNDRVMWNDGPAMAWFKYAYSSCHLPDRLQDYFAGLESARGQEAAPAHRALRIRELDASAESLAYLRSFYAGLYTDEFPDPDERESLENMQRYLELKAQGWYGKNNYHIVVGELEGRPVGGFVIDYLEQANAGVIEFLFVSRRARARGLGRLLLQEAELLLRLDALAHTMRELDWIIAEMNDPFVRPDVPDNMDPFERAEIWSRWGYGLLDFPYVQPPLSAEQEAVTGLGLICKCLDRRWAGQQDLPATSVVTAVEQYLHWAMRIEQPRANPQFQHMKAHVDALSAVKLLDLARYAGSADSAPRIVVEVVTDVAEPAFASVMSFYASTFRSRRAAVPRSSFEQALRDAQARRYGYHLWALRPDSDGPVSGMASFFTLGACGFGGYVALAGTMQRTGRLAPLLARIERSMLADNDASRGWFIECENKTEIAPFVKSGFRVIDLPYAQPKLDRRSTSGPTMRLLYKPFGRVYGVPALRRDALLWSVEAIFRHVYGITDPAAHPGFSALAAAATSEMVPFSGTAA